MSLFRRGHFGHFGLASILVLGLTACTHDSYLVVTLLAGDSAFAEITAVELTVSTPGRNVKSLTPDYDATKYPAFDTHTGPRLSVAFTPENTSPVDVVVIVKSASNPCLGRGLAPGVLLQRGDTTRIEVKVFHVIGACPGVNGGPDASADGASPDGRVTFPGCDPVSPATCPAAQACFVDCIGKAATCAAAGTRGPGELCASNADCAVGNACFDFSGISGCGATTKICMRFCAQDTDCAASTAGALAPEIATAAYSYPGGACRTNVECGGGLVTSYRRCTFECDPRGDGRTGCPGGLFCFLFQNASGSDSPDCGCRDGSRIGTDGASCTSSASCAPGFICNQTGITRACRQLCKPGAPSDCGNGKACTSLSNNALFGVCL